MDRYAIVKDDIVINVIVWNGEDSWNPPEGTILVKSDFAGIGDIHNNGKLYYKTKEVILNYPITEEQILEYKEAPLVWKEKGKRDKINDINLKQQLQVIYNKLMEKA